MPAKKRVLIIGNCSLNLIMLMQSVPDGGETVTEQYYYYVPGGSAVNAALMLSRLGTDPVLCARTARDANGRYMGDFLTKNGIDTRFVNTEPRSKTGLEVIIATDEESNRSIIYEGANRRLSADDVDNAMSCRPDAVLLQLSSPTGAISEAVKSAREQEIPLIVYSGHGCTSFDANRLGEVKLFITDEKIVTALTGHTVFKPASLVSVCIALANVIKAEYYVIKLRTGVTLTYNNMLHFLYTPPCDAVVADPSTASDTFAAALTHEFMLKGSLERAVKFAGIIESMTLPGPGASASVPKAEDIEEFIRENGIDFKL